MSIYRFSMGLKAPENERFIVRKGADMLALLRAMAARRTPTTLHFGDSNVPLQTRLIGVNPAFEELIFAPGSDPAALARLLAAGSFGVETSFESIGIQFIASHAEEIQVRRERAFRARMPDTLTRLQRRETVHVPTPQDKPSYCVLRAGPTPGNPRGELRSRVLDVSTGGLGLALPAAQSTLLPGKILRDCLLEVPGMGTLRCTLGIVYMKHLQDGSNEQRAGLRFIDLAALSREQVRAYVTRLERAQLAALAATQKAA